MGVPTVTNYDARLVSLALSLSSSFCLSFPLSHLPNGLLSPPSVAAATLEEHSSSLLGQRKHKFHRRSSFFRLNVRASRCFWEKEEEVEWSGRERVREREIRSPRVYLKIICLERDGNYNINHNKLAYNVFINGWIDSCTGICVMEKRGKDC